MNIFKILFFVSFFSIFSFAQNLEKVTLQLNWKYQFEFAGFIAAYEKGFYEEIGLDLEIKEYDKNTDVIEDIKLGKATFGLYDLSLLEYYDKDKPLVLLANYLKKSALVFIANQEILTPYDFKNKTIMIEDAQLKNSILKNFLIKFDIKTSDFKKIVPHSFQADDFIDGKIDIMSAYLSNELFDIKKSKKPYNIIDPSNYELFNFSLNLFTTKNNVLKNPMKVKKFIEATNKGWAYAFENRDEIINIIYDKYSNKKSKEALLFESYEIEKLMMTNIYPIGSIREELVQDMIVKLKKYHKDIDSLNINEIIFNKKYLKNEAILDINDLRYLNTKKEIKMCIDPDWFPFEKIKDGEHIGISKDYMSSFEKELSIPVKLINTNNWKESLDKIKLKECDILALAMKTKEREEYLSFTKPYLKAPLVIATKTEELFIPDVKNIIDKKRLGIVSGYAMLDILKARYPNNKIVEVDSVKDGLEKVTSGHLYGFVDTLPTIGYEIQNHYLSELKIAGKFEETLDLSIAIKDDIHLLKIFDKLIDNISEEQKHQIFNKWVNIQYEKSIDYSTLWKISLVFLIIILLFIKRQKDLVKYNKKIEEQKEKAISNNEELKATKAKLEATLKNFETLLSSTMDSIFVIEKNVCIDTNQNGLNLLNFKMKEELIGKNVFDFIDEDSIPIVKKNLKFNLEPFEIYINSQKQRIPSLVKIRTTFFNSKAVYIISVIDLRELKHKEILFLKQSKMASMGEMIGNIAHQWRQPLSVISAVSTGLKLKIVSNTGKTEDILKSLDNMNDSAQYLSQTIDDFRNFYKSDKSKAYVSVKSIIDKNVNLLQSSLKAYNIDIFVQEVIDYELNTFQNELIQAILNILNNAKDVLILNNQEKERYIFINSYEEDDKIVLSIKDNAGGIPEDIINKIFEPYFTTKHKSNGTGIGLYMTHQIIEGHIEGKIEVQNETYTYENMTYKGACFKIYLPKF